ncbi:hypothetical protein SAMN04487972_102283 [Paracoccus halophilus]|uniref:Uncharacterized protein n=1 Tax=Paracoccus halophilus TaxID=376733 RepID=A0A099F8V2_9RHOB|nr:hypothetical protein [Paracoccus halophilus]KGJ06671.1 hypothetical protein IT41_00370 [Paracoccus halophilus]SFA42302.1 hypothetical protein SAMN04487972_102283 [Paracoccus halophilus]
MNSRDRHGLIPGEAVIAARVMMASTVPPLAAITGPGVEVEPVREFDEGGTNHAAMTAACAAALPASGGGSCWITDWDNSRYRAAELSYSELRLRSRLDQNVDISHSPLIFGDVVASKT